MGINHPNLGHPVYQYPSPFLPVYPEMDGAGASINTQKPVIPLGCSVDLKTDIQGRSVWNFRIKYKTIILQDYGVT